MKTINEKGKNIITIAAVIIFMYWISQNVQWGLDLLDSALDVLSPVLAGGAIAFILYLPMNRYMKLLARFKGKFIQKNKGIIAFVLSLISVVALLLLLMQIVIPELVNTFTALTTAIPDTYDRIYDWVIVNQEHFPKLKEWITGISIDWGSLFQRALTFITGGVANVFDTTFNMVAVVLSGVYNMLMSFIIAMYLLLNRQKLGSQCERVLRAYCPERLYCMVMKIGHLCQEAFSQYIIGKCLDALVIGAMCFVGMTLFKFPYAAMISVIIGVTAMIPIIGGYIGMAIGALLIVVVNPMQALGFLGFILFLQIFEGNLIYPKIMGESIGLPAMWIIIAITVGGGMFGFLGMLLSVPVVSVLYALIKESVEKRLENRITVVESAPLEETHIGREKKQNDEQEESKEEHDE